MKRVIFLVVAFLFIGCGDAKEETVSVAKVTELKKELPPKTTYATPKFRQNGELYKKTYQTTVIKPTHQIKASGNVKDILIEGNLLYAGTDAGVIEIYNLDDQSLVESIKVPSFINKIFKEEMISTIYSLDKIGDKIVLVCSDDKAPKSLYLYENKTLKRVDSLPNLTIVKVRFINENQILIGLLSNELLLYDIAEDKQVYRVGISEASFADMTLSEDKKEVVVGCESGIVYHLNTKNGELITVLQGANKDKSYKVDIRGDLILSAGQDSKGVVYDLANSTYKIMKVKFLVYAGAFSPSGAKVAFAYNEDNEIMVIDAKGIETTATLLSGQKSTLNAIVFIDEKQLVSASDDEFIMLWKIP